MPGVSDGGLRPPLRWAECCGTCMYLREAPHRPGPDMFCAHWFNGRRGTRVVSTQVCDAYVREPDEPTEADDA